MNEAISASETTAGCSCGNEIDAIAAGRQGRGGFRLASPIVVYGVRRESARSEAAGEAQDSGQSPLTRYPFWQPVSRLRAAKLDPPAPAAPRSLACLQLRRPLARLVGAWRRVPFYPFPSTNGSQRPLRNVGIDVGIGCWNRILRLARFCADTVTVCRDRRKPP
jgi:hypothetical protein